MSLFWRVALLNAAVLIAALTALAISPATVSARPTGEELGVLAAGAIALLAVNIFVLRRVFAPLHELTTLMGRVDPRAPGKRIVVDRSVSEVAALEAAFNEMLDRLEDERRSSSRRALDAQERERRRLARELHDELGQTLTGIVLLLDALPEAAEAQEAARAAVEKTRDIARGLRPVTLDEFGLRSALTTLAAGVAERSGLRVRHELQELASPEHDLTIYRTAQESLTNVVRHAEATAVTLSLHTDDDKVVLTVADDGRGVAPDALHDAGGIGGMRERAMLAGGTLEIGRGELGGTEVRLEVPV